MSKSRPTMSCIEAGRKQVTNPVKNTEIDPNAVMPVQCQSCPWRSPTDPGRLNLSPAAMLALQYQVIHISNQRCHAPALSGQAETKVCRGARDYQLQYYHQVGVLTEPTDVCWQTTLENLRTANELG